MNSRGEPFRFRDWAAFWKAAGGQNVTPSSPVVAGAPTSRKSSRAAWLIVGGAIGAIILYALVRGGSGPTSEQAKPSCREDWAKCTDNADLMNHYWKTGEAQRACKEALGKSVKFGDPEWTWGAFGSFRIGDDYPKTGLLKLVDPDVQIPNGFGAKVHSKVECWYDLNKKSATIMSYGAVENIR